MKTVGLRSSCRFQSREPLQKRLEDFGREASGWVEHLLDLVLALAKDAWWFFLLIF